MTTPLNPMDREAWEKRLKEIEARAEAATPGPWFYDLSTVMLNPESHPIAQLWNQHEEDFENHVPNGAFIAHARQDIPDLVAYARALQSSNEALTSEVCTLNNRIEEIDRTYNFQREEDAAKLLTLQSQLTEALAEVDRLRGCHVHRLYFDIDPHNFSTRPCSTCEAISAVTKTDFGCKVLRVEKARQPK